MCPGGATRVESFKVRESGLFIGGTLLATLTHCAFWSACTLEVVRLDTTAQCARSFHRCSRMSCRRVTQSWKSRECAYWHADCCDGAWRKLQDYAGKASDRGSSQPSRSSPSVPHAHTHEHARALVCETAFSHFLPTYLLPPSPLGFCRRLSLAPADPSFSRPRLAEF